MKTDVSPFVILFNLFDDKQSFRQDSVARSVNQATGLPDFEDCLRTGTKLEVRNGLQSVRTIPGINLVSPLGLAMTLGAVWRHKFLY